VNFTFTFTDLITFPPAVEGFLKKSPSAAKQFLTTIKKFESARVGKETSGGICMTRNEFKRGEVAAK